MTKIGSKNGAKGNNGACRTFLLLACGEKVPDRADEGQAAENENPE